MLGLGCLMRLEIERVLMKQSADGNGKGSQEALKSRGIKISTSKRKIERYIDSWPARN